MKLSCLAVQEKHPFLFEPMSEQLNRKALVWMNEFCSKNIDLIDFSCL